MRRLRKWGIALVGVLLWLSDLTSLPETIARWETWAGQLTPDQSRVVLFACGAVLVLWPGVIRPAVWPDIKRRYSALRRPTLQVVFQDEYPFVERRTYFEQGPGGTIGPPKDDYVIYRVAIRNNSRSSIGGVRLRIVGVVQWNSERFGGFEPFYLKLTQDDDRFTRSLNGTRLDPRAEPTFYDVARIELRKPDAVGTRFLYASDDSIVAPSAEGYRITLEVTAINQRPFRAKCELVPSARSFQLTAKDAHGYERPSAATN